MAFHPDILQVDRAHALHGRILPFHPKEFPVRSCSAKFDIFYYRLDISLPDDLLGLRELLHGQLPQDPGIHGHFLPQSLF